MKVYIIWTFILMNSFLFSQLTDTTCLKSRWISITPSTRNEFLFPEDNENNIFFKILELAVNEKIDLYWKFSCDDSSEKYILPHIKFQKDTIHVCKGCLINQNWIELIISFDLLSNNIGEDSIIIDEKGEPKLAYPPTLHWNFDINSIKHVIIKEDNIYIKEIDNVDFTVSEIGFEIQSYNTEAKIFWVDMKELKWAMKMEPVYIWYNRLIKRDYRGFQYAQKSCYE
jgi:hypothetical protein